MTTEKTVKQGDSEITLRIAPSKENIENISDKLNIITDKIIGYALLNYNKTE